MTVGTSRTFPIRMNITEENNIPKRIDLEHVLSARKRIHKHIHVTPMITCGALDREAGRKVLLKLENQQKTGSFKARGAANYVLASCEDNGGTMNGSKTFMTHSSGNHAQGELYRVNLFCIVYIFSVL